MPKLRALNLEGLAMKWIIGALWLNGLLAFSTFWLVKRQKPEDVLSTLIQMYFLWWIVLPFLIYKQLDKWVAAFVIWWRER